MTKKILPLAIFLLTLGLFFCSSDQIGTSDPTKTSEEFDNPTGTLTSANALSVCNGGMYGSSIAILNDPEHIFGDLTIDAVCKETSGDTLTIDWGCVFTNVPGCTGDGTTETTDDPEKDFIASIYDGFSVDCDAADPEDDIAVAFDGATNVSRTNQGIYCSNLTFNFDGSDKSFDGCRNSDGHILVRLDDESFVVSHISPNIACTEVTFAIRDKNGTQDVVCDIQELDGTSCDEIENISKIGNCVIQ
jgi:hypothetical protein